MAIQSISYGDKTDLNTTSVPDANKVKASDMNEVKTVVNNNATELTNTQTSLGNLNTYSTSETIIGTWKTKTLYRKIIRAQGNGASGSHTIAHNISNLERVVNCYGLFGNDNGTSYPTGNGIFTFNIDKIDTTNITYTGDSAYSQYWYADIVLEYIKTS